MSPAILSSVPFGMPLPLPFATQLHSVTPASHPATIFASCHCLFPLLPHHLLLLRCLSLPHPSSLPCNHPHPSPLSYLSLPPSSRLSLAIIQPSLPSCPIAAPSTCLPTASHSNISKNQHFLFHLIQSYYILFLLFWV